MPRTKILPLWQQFRNLFIFGVAGAMLAVVLASLFFAEKYEVVLFSTVYSADITASPRDREQAATFFGETIMGWTRDPVFQTQITQKIQTDIELFVRKQERQNLILTIQHSDKSIAEQSAQYVQELLEQRIQEFNDLAHHAYGISFSQSSSRNKALNWVVFAFLGAILGVAGAAGGIQLLSLRKSIDKL